MDNTWKPTLAGTLDIVIAIFSLWFLFAISLEGAVFWSIFPKSLFGLNTLSTAYLIIVLPLLGIAIISLVGGIYSLKRRKWILAIIGSIAAIFSWTPVALLVTPVLFFVSTPLGIFVVILVVKSKGEFK